MLKRKYFFLVIIVIIGVIAILLRFTPNHDSDVLIIEFPNNEILEITFDKIIEMEGVVFENYDKPTLVKIVSIQQLLPEFDFIRLLFHSTDGAKVLIENETNILIALEKNNDQYTLRLIMPDDNFSQRWLKNVCRITVGIAE